LIFFHCVIGENPEICSEDGGNILIVEGMTYSLSGLPAANALVVIRSSDYLAEIINWVNSGPRRLFCMFDAHRPKRTLSFYGGGFIPKGMFVMEARDGNNNCVLIGNMESDSSFLFRQLRPTPPP